MTAHSDINNQGQGHTDRNASAEGTPQRRHLPAVDKEYTVSPSLPLNAEGGTSSAHSSAIDTPVSVQPITEPSTQDSFVTALDAPTKQQAKEKPHVQTGLHEIQTRRDGPAKRLRSASVTGERDKRQQTLTATIAKRQDKHNAPKANKEYQYHKQVTTRRINRIGIRPGPYH